MAAAALLGRSLRSWLLPTNFFLKRGLESRATSKAASGGGRCSCCRGGEAAHDRFCRQCI
jgi:hypothetical protein